MTWIFIVLGLLAGALVPAQSAFNATLSKHIGGVIPSATVVFLIAFLFMLGISLCFRIQVPSQGQMAQVPWPAWLGGILGVGYILMLIYVIPKLGVGLTTSLVVFGQILMSLTIDHFALFGLPQHTFSWLRAAGIVLIGAGVGLIKPRHQIYSATISSS